MQEDMTSTIYESNVDIQVLHQALNEQDEQPRCLVNFARTLHLQTNTRPRDEIEESPTGSEADDEGSLCSMPTSSLTTDSRTSKAEQSSFSHFWNARKRLRRRGVDISRTELRLSSRWNQAERYEMDKFRTALKSSSDSRKEKKGFFSKFRAKGCIRGWTMGNDVRQIFRKLNHHLTRSKQSQRRTKSQSTATQDERTSIPLTERQQEFRKNYLQLKDITGPSLRPVHNEDDFVVETKERSCDSISKQDDGRTLYNYGTKSENKKLTDEDGSERQLTWEDHLNHDLKLISQRQQGDIVDVDDQTQPDYPIAQTVEAWSRNSSDTSATKLLLRTSSTENSPIDAITTPVSDAKGDETTLRDRSPTVIDDTPQRTQTRPRNNVYMRMSSSMSFPFTVLSYDTLNSVSNPTTLNSSRNQSGAKAERLDSIIQSDDFEDSLHDLLSNVEISDVAKEQSKPLETPSVYCSKTYKYTFFPPVYDGGRTVFSRSRETSPNVSDSTSTNSPSAIVRSDQICAPNIKGVSRCLSRSSYPAYQDSISSKGDEETKITVLSKSRECIAEQTRTSSPHSNDWNGQKLQPLVGSSSDILASFPTPPTQHACGDLSDNDWDQILEPGTRDLQRYNSDFRKVNITENSRQRDLSTGTVLRHQLG